VFAGMLCDSGRGRETPPRPTQADLVVLFSVYGAWIASRPFLRVVMLLILWLGPWLSKRGELCRRMARAGSAPVREPNAHGRVRLRAMFGPIAAIVLTFLDRGAWRQVRRYAPLLAPL